MQVTETKSEGLSRVYEVVVAQADLAARLDAKINEIQPQVRLKGFRPGKVPASHIRKMFGQSMMSEIIEDAVKTTSQEVLTERDLRAASFPDIEPKGEMEAVVKGEADLAYELRVELMPEFDPMEPKTLKLERPVAEVSDEDITTALEKLAADNTVYSPRRKGSKAKDGDELLVNYKGEVDGVAFEGGTADDASIVLGAGRLIPGFEDQLVGAKVDETVEVNVTFPDDYPRPDVAGKDAVFTVEVKEVRAPKDAEVNDDLAKAVGLEDLDALKEALKSNLERDFEMQSRQRVKRRLLDALDEGHAFDLPPGMVDQEFAQIWTQVERDMEAGEIPDEDKDKSEDDLKAEYRTIAERRVRLGLVLAEIGRASSIDVSEEELARAISMEARRYPGQEAQVVKMFQENANARAQLRAPIYEEKVVDYILELAEVTDVSVDRETLFKDEDES